MVIIPVSIHISVSSHDLHGCTLYPPLDRVVLGDLVLNANLVLLCAAARDAEAGPLKADIEVHA